MIVDNAEIEALVREVVTRTVGLTPPAGASRTLVGEETVRRLPAGKPYIVPANALITPLARQVALERDIALVEQQEGQPVADLTAAQQRDPRRKVALGADHGGFQLKEQLKETVAQAGFVAVDCGTHSTDSVDYPDYAYSVARLVANGQAWRGIIVDGAGIGSCMAANKVPGVRAALCYDQATAVNSREHNNANVLTLGAGLIGPQLAGQIVTTWLGTEFAGGRHARRVAKIDALDQRYR